MNRPRSVPGRAGTTLTELMVAVVVMSVGILGLFGSFRYITRSLSISRASTLATNLAQERVETLKNLNYYGLLLTTATATDARFTPNIVYDNGGYPPETIAIGGITFTRYTYVTMAQVSAGNVVAVGYNYPDTGLKEIVVNVVWTANGEPKKWTLTNLLENPNVNPLDSSIAGGVTYAAGGAALPGAVVSVEQNPAWSATADASGQYQFSVYHGTYTVRASSAGFYDAVSTTIVVAQGLTGGASLALQQIATGTVAGIAWYNSDLVISQVVADTYTVAGDGNLHDIEYVELFNPTTFPINIGVTHNAYPKPVSLRYFNTNGDYTYDYYPGSLPHYYDMVNVTTYVAPGHYYLIANATSFYVAGQWINADAFYDSTTSYPKVIANNKAASVALYRGSSDTFPDMVGWADNSASAPPWYEGTYIPNASGNNGLGSPTGKQIVRVSSPAASAADTSTYGRAYDSNSNNKDFLYESASFTGFVYAPKNSSAGAFAVVAGKVPSGVVVSASDPNSGSVTAYQANATSGALSLPYVPFTLTGVTTGTWSLALSYNAYSQILSSVTVTQNQRIGVANAATTPAWPASGLYHVQLSSFPDSGFVKGTVTNASNSPISGITVQSGGTTKFTGSNGQYFMNVSSGSITLIANPNNANPSYIQQAYPVAVSQGAVTTQNFTLSLGGRLTGYCTTGTTPVPNMVVSVLSGGSQAASGTTDATGVFTVSNLSTGAYTVEPVLDVGQDSSPTSLSATMNSTGTVFIGTFTVSGAYGSISGSVRNGSDLVTSGALVVASTNSISSSPPTIAASSAPAQTPYYMTSSKADGTYSLPVRGAATYYLSVYVPVVGNSGSVSITTKTYSGIYVSVSQGVTKDVTLP